MIDFLVSSLQCIDNNMDDKHWNELPYKAEEKVERQKVEQTMDNQTVPIAALILGKIINLQNIIAEHMAYNQYK